MILLPLQFTILIVYIKPPNEGKLDKSFQHFKKNLMNDKGPIGSKSSFDLGIC